MTEGRRDTYVAELTGDLTFEVIRETDGSLTINDGFFDTRSAKHGVSFVLTSVPSFEPVDDQDLVDAIFEALPGKGRLDVG